MEDKLLLECSQHLFRIYKFHIGVIFGGPHPSDKFHVPFNYKRVEFREVVINMFRISQCSSWSNYPA